MPLIRRPLYPPPPPRYIFVSGGVVSGLGKGVTAASLGVLLKARGYQVACMKVDAYLNQDAGTMNPMEHGEVFVTADGLETDQDLGHYERFLNQDTWRFHYLTLGMVFADVLRRERDHQFDGRTVEMVGSVTGDIIRRIELAGDVNDFLIVELGGTFGEYQIQLLLEAARVLTKKHRGRVAHVHVVYLPKLESVGELKSKPAQLSVTKLYESGIQPDVLVCRSGRAHEVDEIRKDKLAGATHLDPEDIFLAPDAESIYAVPNQLEAQGFEVRVLEKLGVDLVPAPDLEEWHRRANAQLRRFPQVEIGLVAKYLGNGDYSLPDAYVSVLEALKHAAAELEITVAPVWIDAEKLEQNNSWEWARLRECHGIIIPQGWGSRGAEGKIQAIRKAREARIPYLGLCYGFQMAHCWGETGEDPLQRRDRCRPSLRHVSLRA